MIDNANGYEEHAHPFLRARNASIGPDAVAGWAARFKPGAHVLELGCGFGVISKVLLDANLTLTALDASPTLIQVFRERFPGVETACCKVEESSLFEREFDGVVAWGLLFLLDEPTQRRVLQLSAGALKPGGQLLFTAPKQAAQWNDSLTGRQSFGLGADVYESILREHGLEIGPGFLDTGDNYYYLGTRPL